MAGSTRFAVAVHILALMAEDRQKPITSEAMAKSIGTNPAVVRRLLGLLSAAGLTTSQLGKGGGSTLARGPKKITLAEIYHAVETPGLIAPQRSLPDMACPVGRHVAPALKNLTNTAEQAFLNALAAVSLKQVSREIAAANAAAKSAA